MALAVARRLVMVAVALACAGCSGGESASTTSTAPAPAVSSTTQPHDRDRAAILEPKAAPACTARVLGEGGHAGGASAENLLRWMRHHRSQVGLVAVRPGSTKPVLAVNPDGWFPLASVQKLQLLIAYAELASVGKLDPNRSVPLDALARWYWPGTDGGAHPNAIADWKSRGVITGRGVHRRVPLREVVWAMIRWSDNAATDYVLRLVGGPLAVKRTARGAGLRYQDPSASVYGTFLSWAKSPASWARASPLERSRLAARLAATTSPGEARFAQLPDLTQQALLAQRAWRGTPRQWALVLAALYEETGTTSSAGRIIDQSLEWPLTEFPSNQSRFERFGTKGGSLPGVVTEASFFRPVGGKPLAVALFLRCVPRGLQDELLSGYAHQAFMQQLADDPRFLARVRDTLSQKGS
jgi:D-alanyl-D-alanine carboxypeptidase